MINRVQSKAYPIRVMGQKLKSQIFFKRVNSGKENEKKKIVKGPLRKYFALLSIFLLYFVYALLPIYKSLAKRPQ